MRYTLLHTLKNHTQGKFVHTSGTWLLIQQIVIAPISLITTIILAQILSISEYGYYKYAISLMGIFSAFGLTGIVAVAQINIQRGDDIFFELAFQYRKILRWIPSVLSFATALYYAIHQNLFLGSLFTIFIFYYFFVETYNLYSIAAVGKGHFKLAAFFEIGNYVASYVPPVIVAYFLHGNQNIVFIIFVTMFTSQFLFRYISYRYVRSRFGFDQHNHQTLENEERVRFRKESLIYSANSGMASVFTNAQSVVVFNRLGAGDNAIYSLAVTFANFASNIIVAPMGKILLVVGQMIRDSIPLPEQKKYIWSQVRLFSIFALLISITIMALLPVVYMVLFPKYINFSMYAVVYATILFPLGFLPTYHYFMVTKQLRIINIVQFVSGVMSLGLLFFATIYYGIWGAIGVQVLMSIVTNLVWGILFNRET